jgi:uncharacterized membrane protein SpoIIM required for sporulation
MAIFWVLMGMHIASYCISFFRRQETLRRGQPDINGVLRARWESIFTTLEVIVSAIVVGFIFNTEIRLPYEDFDS